MTPYELLLLVHILLFVYWLGGDLGVFYSSSYVVDPTLSRESRLVAAKIMLGCDLIPRVCMSLMLTVGGMLAHYMGVEHAAWQLVLIVLVGPFWLSMVLLLHFKHGAPYIPALTKIDFYFRWLVVVCVIASCGYAYASGSLDAHSWVIAKLLAFAFLVFCGLMIRVKLAGFTQTYVKILQDNYDEQDNKAMIASLNKVRPWVITIWIVLLFEAYLGVAKPWS